MPEEKKEKTKPSKENSKTVCVDDLRHAEYYDMQSTFDSLYARSQQGETFTGLMDIILSRENILLAYRNIKTNTGSYTPGTDGLTIKDVGKLTPEEVVEKVKYIVSESKHGYRPKPVRRKDIPKPNGSLRPLGIPCIWDRLVQQCIKQVMEPICEAKFSDNSYGFRPDRSAENAVQKVYRLMQRSNLHYVVEFDIKGFFDNVNHPKLIRQIWAMGIHDKTLIWVIKRILKAPIKMPDGSIIIPEKGTPQGGIISPLLANIVLNELDNWIESQWQRNPVVYKYSHPIRFKGYEDHTAGYAAMKKTGLKEMFIVRYADDFRILCRTKSQANRTKVATTKWLKERLGLDVSEEKTKVVNVKRKYSEFLGFKIKVHWKGAKRVVKSRICDKARKRITKEFVNQVKMIARPKDDKMELESTKRYNSMVLGIHNYYAIATDITVDLKDVQWRVSRVITNRLHGGRLLREGRPLTKVEQSKFGKSEQVRFIRGVKEPIYPVGYVQHRKPMDKNRLICRYTEQGRVLIHDNLQLNTSIMRKLMKQPLKNRSAEYMDNRISLFSAQKGKCAVTGMEFTSIEEIHCHHKTPRNQGGSDKYENLILVSDQVHRLIHANKMETIQFYMKLLNLNSKQLNKVNELRKMIGIAEITEENK